MRALLLMALMVLGGCGVHVGADPARMSLRPVYPPERAWPALAEPTGVHAATVDWVVRDAADGRELLRRPVYAIERSAQVGACTVRELRRIGARGSRARAMLIDVEAAVEGHPAKGFIGRLREHRETPFPVARTPTSVEAGLVRGVSLRELDRPSRYGPVVEHMVADRAFEFQPPLSGASFLARRDTTVCQSIACRSTLKPIFSSACLPTGGSWFDDCRSVACIITMGVPS